jgi:hypothetical protein
MVLVGAILWNGWIFGFLNHGTAGYLHMSISELEVVGQPRAWLFNFLEDASGICMIIGALGLIVTLGRKFNRVMLLILVVIAAIGVLTLYDVAHPLDCNRYNNPVCLAKINDNEVSHTNVLHNDESRITAYVTIALTILVVIWAPLKALERFELIGLIVIVAGVVTTLVVLDIDSNILLGAVNERIWNILVSADIGYVAWKLMSSKPSRRSAG